MQEKSGRYAYTDDDDVRDRHVREVLIVESEQV